MSGSTVGDIVDAGERALPSLAIPRASFEARLRELLASPTTPGVERLHQHAADLCLAHACAEGVPGAVELFVDRHLADLERHLRRFAAVPGLVDEVRRELEDKLLLARGRLRPGIVAYTGRGPLEHWVAITAQRTALSVLRTGQRPDPGVDWIDLLAGSSVAASMLLQLPPPPDIASLNDRYGAAVKQAFREAVSELTPRQRTVLRLCVVGGVTHERGARMLGVNQSTVTRTVHAALDRVNRRMKTLLGERHGLSDSEVSSLVADVRARLDLSLSGALVGEETAASRG